MKAVLFGATGMIGQGVLRECLLDRDVDRVVSVVRKPSGTTDPKLLEVVHGDFYDFSAIESDLAAADACFFTLGVTSVGVSEADYRRVTVDIAVATAKSMLRASPQCVFVFVSGAGTGGRAMWARVKADAENAILAMPLRGAYMFRPGLIQPMHGIQSRTTLYRTFYAIAKPFMPLLRQLPSITTTERVGRAMLNVARRGYPKRILEARDINEAARP